MIKIKTTKRTGWGTEIQTIDGAAIHGVRSCNITINVDDIITAKLDINVLAVDVEAHPLLSLDTVTAAAAHYGFKLVVMEGDVA